jgi:hypothetical protein
MIEVLRIFVSLRLSANYEEKENNKFIIYRNE